MHRRGGKRIRMDEPPPDFDEPIEPPYHSEPHNESWSSGGAGEGPSEEHHPEEGGSAVAAGPQPTGGGRVGRMTRLRARGGVPLKAPIIDEDDDDIFFGAGRFEQRQELQKKRKAPRKARGEGATPREPKERRVYHEADDRVVVTDRETTMDENNVGEAVQYSIIYDQFLDGNVISLLTGLSDSRSCMEPVYLHQNGHRAAVRFPVCNYSRSVNASLRRDAGIAEFAGAKLLANLLHCQTVDPLRPASLQLTPPPLRRQPTPFNPAAALISGGASGRSEKGLSEIRAFFNGDRASQVRPAGRETRGVCGTFSGTLANFCDVDHTMTWERMRRSGRDHFNFERDGHGPVVLLVVRLEGVKGDPRPDGLNPVRSLKSFTICEFGLGRLQPVTNDGHFEADRCRSRDRQADGAALAVTGRRDRRPGNSSNSYCRWVELAAQCAIKHMDSIASPFPISLDNKEPLIHLAMTARKIVNMCHRTMVEIAVDADRGGFGKAMTIKPELACCRHRASGLCHRTQHSQRGQAILSGAVFKVGD
ncbi:stromal antigen [Culex quinquefasciatus]|uniref:Stromal antigen n=1 Tax=Culex quinquefasciatus TaxID=7176 RepID=B0W7H0_CULQU|nr:stromal antigen [Culex quinquefasciatus]|eukprot:XP_001844654.1 stromal antigen [Culex quinquefasciatus]